MSERTVNDRRLTKAMVKIPRKYRKAADAFRSGRALDGVAALEELTNWVDAARRRGKEIVNEKAFPPSRGPISG